MMIPERERVAFSGEDDESSSHDELFGGRLSSENLTVKLGPTQLDNTNLGMSTTLQPRRGASFNASTSLPLLFGLAS